MTKIEQFNEKSPTTEIRHLTREGHQGDFCLTSYQKQFFRSLDYGLTLHDFGESDRRQVGAGKRAFSH